VSPKMPAFSSRPIDLTMRFCYGPTLLSLEFSIFPSQTLQTFPTRLFPGVALAGSGFFFLAPSVNVVVCVPPPLLSGSPGPVLALLRPLGSF